MYDWAHGQNDAMEGITHSLCSMEYRDHRPLYEWFPEQLGVFKPRQIEFARLNINYTADEQAQTPPSCGRELCQRLG